jgi:hypothetical protein
VRFDIEEAEAPSKYPSRGTFFACCASTMTATASLTTATTIDDTAPFGIAHLIVGVIYHANRGKEKCDLRREATGIRRVGKADF